MTPGRASETARFVAIQRAHHHLFAPEPKLLRDDLALAISGLPDADAVKAAMGGLIDGFSQLGGPDAAAAFMRQIEHSVCARSGLVEHRLDALKGNGLSQLVILGAGLDTLAYRRPDLLGKLTVFEVDHLDTQAFKRQASSVGTSGNSDPRQRQIRSVRFRERDTRRCHGSRRYCERSAELLHLARRQYVSD